MNFLNQDQAHFHQELSKFNFFSFRKSVSLNDLSYRFVKYFFVKSTNSNKFFFFENREFVNRLRDSNKKVYLITGGFDCLIEPVADELGIPLDHMFANRLYFNFNGKHIFLHISYSHNLTLFYTIHHNFIASDRF